MIYRITIDLAFENEAPIKAIKNTALDHFPKAVTINPGGEQEERGYIKLLHCYHDEQPNKPCDLLELHQTPTPEPTIIQPTPPN